METSKKQKDVSEFKKVLSQINDYMKQHKARYSFILTNRELVPIPRLDDNGNLQLADSIPWNRPTSNNPPKLTVLLGLWYLGMLAADDAAWKLG